jgi:hypothetical protein
VDELQSIESAEPDPLWGTLGRWLYTSGNIPIGVSREIMVSSHVVSVHGADAQLSNESSSDVCDTACLLGEVGMEIVDLRRAEFSRAISSVCMPVDTEFDRDSLDDMPSLAVFFRLRGPCTFPIRDSPYIQGTWRLEQRVQPSLSPLHLT